MMLQLIHIVISQRELAMVLACGLIICLCRLSWRGEAAYFNRTPVDCNSSTVFAKTLPHALEPDRVIFTKPSVFGVIRMRTYPKIRPTVVQSIVVSVVGYLTYETSRDEIAHADSGATRELPIGIETLGAFAPPRKPVPLREPFKVFTVDDGILPLRKWNQAIGWIERLCSGVPRKRLAGHTLTSNGSVLLAAILA